MSESTPWSPFIAVHVIAHPKIRCFYERKLLFITLLFSLKLNQCYWSIDNTWNLPLTAFNVIDICILCTGKWLVFKDTNYYANFSHYSPRSILIQLTLRKSNWHKSKNLLSWGQDLFSIYIFFFNPNGFDLGRVDCITCYLPWEKNIVSAHMYICIISCNTNS